MKTEVVIGLVNLMPLAAAKTTEILFSRLLQNSAGPHPITLRLFAPGEYNHAALQHDPWTLPEASRVDCLIITGAEPQADAMEDEPLWPYLQKLCDWAAENTISTIWSCFAAHAAVLHIDGLARSLLEEKISGVFKCQKVAEHFLLENMPTEWLVPHSRQNSLAETTLSAGGYQILSRSERIGADSFVKLHGKSLFLFLQGHLEYSPLTLFGEYRRDVKRYFAGERRDYPNMPENYFDQTTEEQLGSLRSCAGSKDGQFHPQFIQSVIKQLHSQWRLPAEQLFSAWISHIAEQKRNDDTGNLHL